jgi:hypothetical protein
VVFGNTLKPSGMGIVMYFLPPMGIIRRGRDRTGVHGFAGYKRIAFNNSLGNFLFRAQQKTALISRGFQGMVKRI